MISTQITSGIKISVLSQFDGVYLKNAQNLYAFSYQITIQNLSNNTVQLLTRHWEIFDSLHPTEIIDGDGVVGQTPVILPGKQHVYQSGCLLKSTLGTMLGHYQMLNFSTNQNFIVQIPAFNLSAPFVLN